MEKQAAGGRRVLLGRNLSQNRESLCEKALLAHIKTVFAKLDSRLGWCSPVTDMNAKRIRDSYNLKAFRQLGYRDVPERRNRTRMFVCAGCRLWIQQNGQVIRVSYV